MRVQGTGGSEQWTNLDLDRRSTGPLPPYDLDGGGPRSKSQGRRTEFTMSVS